MLNFCRAIKFLAAGNAANIEEIKNNHSALMELYKTYSEKLKPFIKTEEENSDKPLIDEPTLSDAFEAMREVSQVFDYDSLNFILQSLAEYRMPEHEAEHYKKLKDAAHNLDWEKIKDLLK